MGSEPFIGEIILFAGNFAPRGWAFCNGQMLSIAQHTALFSLLGTTYGGNGQTNFALPDLRGRVPVGPGQGPGLTNRNLGEVGGNEKTTLTTSQLPAHTHALSANAAAATATDPTNNVLATSRGALYAAAGTTAAMSPSAIAATGGGQPVPTTPPYLGLNYIIALEGIYPSRD